MSIQIHKQYRGKHAQKTIYQGMVCEAIENGNNDRDAIQKAVGGSDYGITVALERLTDSKQIETVSTNKDKLSAPCIWNNTGKRHSSDCKECGGGIMDRVELWDGDDTASCYHRQGTGYQRRGTLCRNCGSLSQMREYKQRKATS